MRDEQRQFLFCVPFLFVYFVNALALASVYNFEFPGIPHCLQLHHFGPLLGSDLGLPCLRVRDAFVELQCFEQRLVNLASCYFESVKALAYLSLPCDLPLDMEVGALSNLLLLVVLQFEGHAAVDLEVPVFDMLRDLLIVVLENLLHLVRGLGHESRAQTQFIQDLAHVGVPTLLILVFLSGLHKDVTHFLFPVRLDVIGIVCVVLEPLLMFVENRCQLVFLVIVLNLRKF